MSPRVDTIIYAAVTTGPTIGAALLAIGLAGVAAIVLIDHAGPRCGICRERVPYRIPMVAHITINHAGDQ